MTLSASQVQQRVYDAIVGKSTGFTVTFKSCVASFDTGTSEGAKTFTDHTNTPSSVPVSYTTFEVDGDMVRHEDLKILLPALNLAFTPRQDLDQVVFDSKTYAIKKVTTHQLGDTGQSNGLRVVAYELQLRRA